MRVFIFFFVFSVLFFSLTITTYAQIEASTADFYIATNGNDAWSGKLENPNAEKTDGPFASLARARNAVRELKRVIEKRNIVVMIREGRYYINNTVVFGMEDSASDGYTITYTAYPGEEPVFSSGIRIEGWRELEDRPEALPEMARAKVWVADVPKELGRFHTLYDVDKCLPRARSHAFAVDEEMTTENPQSAILFSRGTIKNWANLEDIELVVRWYGFTISIPSLESVDEEQGIARTSIPFYGSLTEWDERPPQNGNDIQFPTLKISSTRVWGVKEGQHAIWVENVLEALDRPGEWVLNTQEGKLYLWPTADKPGDNIFAPTLRELIRVEGNIDFDGPKDKPTQGIIFKGLTFTQADRGVVQKNDMSIQHDWEMIDKGDSLLRFRGAENCSVEECKFFNSGGSAIRLDLYCQRIKILRNEINHLGGAGVLLIGYGPGTKDVNKKNEVINNEIHHCGEIYWHSHGIVMWQSGENHIAHNYIHHMPRKGICLGGVRPQFFNPDVFVNGPHPPFRENAPSIRWHEIKNDEAVKEFARNTPWRKNDIVDWPEITPYLHTRNNIVEYNELYRVAEIMADGAAINISGAGEGNIVRRNYIHDIYNQTVWGIRTDDYQRRTLIEENVMFKLANCGLTTRQENYWINNVIVDAAPNRYIWIGQRDYDGARIVRNIFFHPGGEQGFYEFFRGRRGGISVYQHFANMNSGEIDRNIYYNLEAPDSTGIPIDSLRKVGYGKHSLYADPLFVDWRNGDFRLQPDSPAIKMGIKAIDVREMGLTKIKKLMCSCTHLSDTKTFSKYLWKNSDKEYTKYRIPAIIVTQKGTVLTFCEGRHGDGGDRSDIDLLVRRSSDYGETWSEPSIVWDDGVNTCGNPCPVIDQTTGRIILMMTWNSSAYGYDAIKKKINGTRRPFMCYSDDDGLTWSKPEDLTATCKNSDWEWYATGPGIGIQLKSEKYKNRIVIPANHSYYTNNEDEWGFKKGIGLGAHVILSDDGGATWRMSESVTPRCNESQVVELSDGGVMMTMRSYAGMGCRSISYSEDGGEIWSKVEHTLQLVEPVCQASIIEYGQYNGKKMYLFSNPAAAEDRICMTIKTSFDECKTWSNAKLISDNKAEYSCLTVLPNGNIGLIYEVGRVEEDWEDKGLMFVSINPDELFTPGTLLKSDQLP